MELGLLKRLQPWRARLKFAVRPMMIIDLLAFLPWYVHKILPFDFRALRLLRLFRLLKLIRYSPALQTLKWVVAHEWRALLGALLLMMMLLVFGLHHHLLPGAQRAARAFRQHTGFGLVGA
jgi:voltage-gated potassium channel